MNRTIELFEERKGEAEFYLSILTELLSSTSTIRTVDNQRFGRILKSNFLLMLYNLIEACIRSGFEEIYDAVKSRGVSYQQVSEALKDIWSSYTISKADQRNSTESTYARKVKSIIRTVLESAPLEIPVDTIGIGGNLDARQIRELLNLHDISFVDTRPGDKFRILLVKTKRNSLAHGEESFDEAARDSSMEDLENIKDEVFIFINDVLLGVAARISCHGARELFVIILTKKTPSDSNQSEGVFFAVMASRLRFPRCHLHSAASQARGCEIRFHLPWRHCR